ncbi:hypothetical protein DSM104329_03076 [Capillimicrobium parvum]|uniref:Uncharacterized protein n=1 Tax=Capillimicrobium parvum TaxID=2884022 RepID=A0A9E6XZ78_9ACTN|nr:hypothetical protein [Capillimicrobium parvum]UGS36667.1 hypothetical protein DSM104329_03076 [Capillimicrobium parvum]
MKSVVPVSAPANTIRPMGRRRVAPTLLSVQVGTWLPQPLDQGSSSQLRT